MASFTFRLASPEDLPDLAELIRTSYEQFRGRLVPPSGGITETAESLGGKLESNTCIVAEQGGGLCGCVWFRPEDEALYFHRLAVAPQVRRQGLGRELVAQVEECAHQGGFPAVRLAVRILAPENVEWYRRLGYSVKEIGPDLHEGKPFYVVMEKRLHD